MGRFVGISGRTWIYDESRRIGDGGMGVVFSGSAEDGSSVAVKRVELPGTGEEAQRRRDREMEIGALLASRHAAEELEHVLVALDHAVIDDALLVVMPLADGSLSKALKQKSLSNSDCVEVLLQVVRGLEELHSLGILHRDLKADNVLNIGSRWVLADFGLARDTARGTATYTFTGWGTAAYVAPELWEGQSASVKSDLYALGVLAYEICTGRRPFPGPGDSDYRRQHLTEDPPDLGNLVPPWLSTLIWRLLRKEPAHRPQDARAVLETLQARIGPLTPALERLAEKVQAAEHRRLRAEAEHAQAESQEQAGHDLLRQAYADLDLILEETGEMARAVLPELTVGSSGWTTFWLLAPGGRIDFEGWWELDVIPGDIMVTAGAIFFHKIAALNVRVPRANIVCEKKSDGRLAWHLLQFESRPSVHYSKGPTDRPHGFHEEIFMAERRQMLNPNAPWESPSWYMTKQELDSNLILELLGDLVNL
ncbi:serine/threonine-protein kinase [Streptomyces chartreusis]|uniref:serine/threonine-protein kinase n=1 Tax=Streptomyces chartreusis TaxID=1969 RepID=UPI0037B443DA